MGGLQHRRHSLYLARRYCRPHVAVEMDYASLPLGFGIELGKVVYQSQAHIRDKQLDALQTAILQFAQKLGPTGLPEPRDLP